MITALLVDDEPRTSARLAAMLSDFDEIEVIGAARSVADARLFLRGREPDVVFLDVSMPGGLGVELLPDVGPQTRVIFVTATEVAAVAAFEHGAVDYVLKPFSKERLERAIERLRQVCGAAEVGAAEGENGGQVGLPLADAEPEPAEAAVSLEAKLPLVHVGSQRLELVTVGEIGWITSLDNYTRVRAANGASVMVRRKLAEWEALLPAGVFQRLDRSLIVNMQRLLATQTRSRDQTLLTFEGLDEPLPIGRTAATRLKDTLRV